MTEQDILNVIEQDPWMMQVLLYASSLTLPQWMVSAGFVRNKIWNVLRGREEKHTTDIDLIYFDPNGNDEQQDQALTDQLNKDTGWTWEVVNQSYSHDWNRELPYTSTEDALAHFPETATAIAVTLVDGKLKLIAPFGIEDLVHMVVRPTDAFMVSDAKKNRVRERVREKKWLEKWPQLTLAPF